MNLSPSQVNSYLWKESPLLWTVDHKIKNEKGNVLEFKNHRFLKDIYDDWTPIQVVRKSSQVGFSTTEVIKTACAARYKKYNIIYTLPTFADVSQFVPTKVNQLIVHNPILTDWTKDRDTIFQKRMGTGFIYYRGTFSAKPQEKKMEAGIGIILSADILVMDEADRSDQTILEQYESRLDASDYKGKWYFSNPTAPHTVSQQKWEESDQKHWFIKCEHCGHWQYLDFWKNIKNNKFVCQKCGRELSDETRRNGQWIRKYKNKEISGYWINHLMCSWKTAKQIVQDYETKTRQYFYNFVLGLPYIGSDIVVNQDIILRNIDLAKPNFQENNVLGVDQGLKKHFVLGNKQGIFKIGTTDDWEDIKKLIKLYDVKVAVFDALPDLTEPRKIQKEFIGKVWLSYYKREIQSAEFIKWDPKTYTVYSDRTKIIEMVIDEMINGKLKFQMKPADLEDYIKHWDSLYKIVQTDSMGIERDVWETQGEDHFVHATNLFRLGLNRMAQGETNIKEYKKYSPANDNLAPEIQQIIKNSIQD